MLIGLDSATSQKQSPTKRQMLTFDSFTSTSQQSPVKNVAELQKANSLPVFAEQKPDTDQLSLIDKALQEPRNLLKTRKSCERRQLNINEIVQVDQKIVTFGRFISGQTLGNRITIMNKTAREQMFVLEIDESSLSFNESVCELLSPYNPNDLPISAKNTE